MQKLIIAALGFVALAATASPAHAQAQSYGLFRADAGVTGSYAPAYGRAGFGGVLELKPVSYTHLTLPTNREV